MDYFGFEKCYLICTYFIFPDPILLFHINKKTPVQLNVQMFFCGELSPDYLFHVNWAVFTSAEEVPINRLKAPGSQLYFNLEL